MSITWNDQGMSRIHKHERDSFELEHLPARNHSGVEGGDLYASEDGELILQDNDGHHRIVGEVDGHHYDALRQVKSDDDSEVEITVDHDDDSAPVSTKPPTPPPSNVGARVAALESGMSDLSDKMDRILQHLGG